MGLVWNIHWVRDDVMVLYKYNFATPQPAFPATNIQIRCTDSLYNICQLRVIYHFNEVGRISQL